MEKRKLMPAFKSNDGWLSRLIPFGLIGQIQPQRYHEMLGVLWDNKKDLPYAWNVLNHGVCDGCSLGPYGLRDDVLEGVHLCMTRLKILRPNTMSALDTGVLSDVRRLRNLKNKKLRSLGRLPYPMMRHKKDKGFSRITWDEALELITRSIRAAAPNEMVFLATSRGLTNEVYYVFQKLARTLGTNNVDLCSRFNHTAGVAGLKTTLGLGAPTCSLSDFLGTDLLIIFGTDLVSDQPVTAKYLRFAKKAGTRIMVIDPIRENGPAHDRAPSEPSSALFDTNLMDDFIQVRPGGAIAFINGALKSLVDTDNLDQNFIRKHTTGFAELKESLQNQSWKNLEDNSGIARGELERFAAIYAEANSAVFLYSMDLTQGAFGVENVQAIVNLALARGMLGREKCGVMPMRADSGVQGGGECGFAPDMFPGGFELDEENARRISNLWRHPVSSTPGLELPEMIKAAHRGDVKFIYSIGGNPLETAADRHFIQESMARVPMRVHQDIVLNSSMFLDAEESVLLLPGQTRYEQRGGGISTSTERRIRFTPEIPGHRVGESLPQWEIPALIGRQAMSNGELLFAFNDTQDIRDEMARVMPMYQGIEKLTKEGDQLQWGGPYLYGDGFTSMPNQRARFTVLEPPDRRLRE
jgi:molybdopterin-dependent oxidoreductase alpha subunit